MMYRDLTNNTFSRLTVTGIAVDAPTQRQRIWWCICSCGKRCNVRENSLLEGHTRSCGCLFRDKIAEGGRKNGTHKLTGTPIYRIFNGMLTRCFNPHSNSFKDYGGRGIKPCSFIRASVLNLIKIVGPRPDGMSLERIDNAVGYTCGSCPECLRNGWPMNLTWATAKQQSRNRRNTVYVKFGDTIKCASAWAEDLGLLTQTLIARVDSGSFGERVHTKTPTCTR